MKNEFAVKIPDILKQATVHNKISMQVNFQYDESSQSVNKSITVYTSDRIQTFPLTDGNGCTYENLENEIKCFLHGENNDKN